MGAYASGLSTQPAFLIALGKQVIHHLANFYQNIS